MKGAIVKTILVLAIVTLMIACLILFYKYITIKERINAIEEANEAYINSAMELFRLQKNTMIDIKYLLELMGKNI